MSAKDGPSQNSTPNVESRVRNSQEAYPSLTPEQWRRALRPLLRFAGTFVLLITLLSIPWPGVQSAYAQLFLKTASSVFGSIGPKAVVLFSSATSEKGASVDINMNVGDRTQLKPDGTLPTVNQLFSSRYMAFLPTVLLVSLILSTPLPWRRRLWSLGGGLILIHLFIAFEIILMILFLTNHTTWLSLFELGSFGKRILDGLWNIFVYQIAARFFVPVFIWVLCTFRAGDLELILGLRESSGRPGAQSQSSPRKPKAKGKRR